MTHFEAHIFEENSSKTFNFFDFYGIEENEFKTPEQCQQAIEQFVIEANEHLDLDSRYNVNEFYVMQIS